MRNPDTPRSATIRTKPRANGDEVFDVEFRANGKRHSRRFLTPKEATRYRKTLTTHGLAAADEEYYGPAPDADAQGSAAAAQSMTFRELADAYYKSRSTGVKPSTIATYRRWLSRDLRLTRRPHEHANPS